MVHDLQFSTKTFLTVSTSLNVSGALRISPSAICPSMILSTKGTNVFFRVFFQATEAASTESAIIRTAVSFENGFGPG